MNHIILHLDMDSFFASVEVRENPTLKGLPVIVGADPKGGSGRGVVSTASYEARRYGVRSGMPISRAYRLCPDAAFLPVNFPLYIRTSERVMHIVAKYGEYFEQVSIDEAYLDITRMDSYIAASQIAVQIKEEIRITELLTCSIGIGPSRVVAKIASDMHKPDGLTVIFPENVDSFLCPLPVGMIPGIGRKTEKVLIKRGITSIGQLAETDIQLLRSLFGIWGVYMHTMAHGEDVGPVHYRSEPRSISRETTFETDTDRVSVLEETMDALSFDLHRVLMDEQYAFRTLTIKVRDTRFVTHTRSRTFDHPTSDLTVIKSAAKDLLLEFLNGRKIRLLGLRFSRLSKERTFQANIQEYL
jgi:DNA polymerase IV (DinB-like DNA polymerase)